MKSEVAHTSKSHGKLKAKLLLPLFGYTVGRKYMFTYL